MKFTKLVASLCLASLSIAGPVSAQDTTAQVGGLTVSVGAGTALLTLPDVPAMFALTRAVGSVFVRDFDLSDDFDDETGFNWGGSITAPINATQTVSLSGFFASFDHDTTTICRPGAGQQCSVFALVDNPAATNILRPVGTLTSNAERSVDHWGVALESQWQITPNVMGVTRAPHRRYFALGADVRGIDQDITARIAGGAITAGRYTEDLDTRYYGAYAAWGGEYTPFLFSGLWQRLGLQSSFRLRGGVYYADTDYDGALANFPTGMANINGALSLSDDDVAFIGGVVLETTKRIGRRMMLSLKSEYEYYSYVPEMAYNQIDNLTNAGAAGFQNGTTIGDDDAFSARTMLRLVVGLGPH